MAESGLVAEIEVPDRGSAFDLSLALLSRQPALADVRSDGELSVDILRPQEAERCLAAWSALARRSLEPNVFYAPETALPGLLHLPEGKGAQVVLAWRGSGESQRLVGALPVTMPRRRWLNPFPVRRAAELYGTLSTPLVDPDRPAETLRAMLGALAGSGVSGLLLPFLHADGPVARALEEICTVDGLQQVAFGSHRRAMLRSGLAGADYVRTTLETRRRKEADRQRRRLADEGNLAFDIVRDPGEVARVLDTFLRLESAGWKGRAGTDLAHAPGSADFIRKTASSLASAGAFRIATLSLDGRVIAAGLLAQAGSRVFYLKTTYDEAMARFSPGLLLTLDLTAHLLDDPTVADADSIAVADHPMIDRIWTERFPVTALLVSTRPGGSASFRAALAFERFREHAVDQIKAVRVKVQQSRERGGKHDPKKAGSAEPS